MYSINDTYRKINLKSPSAELYKYVINIIKNSTYNRSYTLINKEPKIICERRYDEGLRFFKGNVCGTIRTIDSGGDKRVIETESNFRIRKLTPRECFRLMGMNDEDIDKIQASGISNSQQYKMAGNSIVINVLEGIFKNLFDINN